MNHISAKLNAFAFAISNGLIMMQSYCVILAIIAGLMLPIIFSLPREERKNAPLWLKLVACFSLCCLVFGTFSPLTYYLISKVLPRFYGDDITNVMLWVMLILCTAFGLITHYVVRRIVSPEIESFRNRVIKKTELERDVRTDVRNVVDLLPKTLKYNPLQYIDLSKGLFIGLDESEQPQYIPMEDWQKQHADLIGTTGAGKGVAAALLLYQSILAGESVFAMDPKDDEWAPHLYREACRAAGKPFALINLNSDKYQIDLLDGIDFESLEELLNAGFSLAKKGDIADFYRLGDRRASRLVSKLHKGGATLRDLFNTEQVAAMEEDVKNFHGELEEVSLLNSINACGGLKLKDFFETGGCVYIIGSMRNPKVISAQRMILIRLIQIAEKRDRIHSKPRPVAIFLDEFKYHISRAAMEGLGAARDKGVHIIMAHQSLDDLEDCPADLKPKAVVGAVVENTKFKLVYKLQDPKTAKWIAEMTGSILVDDESRRVKTDAVLVERMDGDRTIRQAERYYVDTNMLQNLPDLVSFIFTSKSLPRASMISPIKVQKKDLVIYESLSSEQTEINKNPIAFEDDLVSRSSNENLLATKDEDEESDDVFSVFKSPEDFDDQEHELEVKSNE